MEVNFVEQLSTLLDPFERDMAPLNQVILTTYIAKLRSTVLALFADYKETIYSAPTGRQSIIDIGAEGAKISLQSLSKKYRRKLLVEYFSEEGLLLHIMTKVDGLISTELNPLIAEIKEAKNG